MRTFRATAIGSSLLVAAVALNGQQPAPKPASPRGDAVPFRTGVELVNVTATVSDENGRFVSGLREEDFTVYEDERPQTIATFSTDRLPVSLGIALDTSGSMAGRKIQEARAALHRFVYDLLDPNDQIFLYRFSDYPVLVQGWTSDRDVLVEGLDRVRPDGGTALYDTVADAVPLAAQGVNRKKALVLISDGNDTSSHTPLVELRELIRESEVLVYAIGIDSDAPNLPDSPRGPTSYPPSRQPPPPRTPYPFPPPFGAPRGPRPGLFQSAAGGSRAAATRAAADRVNAAALHDLTDESGGRTEIIRDPADLDPATAGIANELSKQYDLSYTSSGRKDGLWHAIRVEIKGRSYRIRARRGYFAN